MERQNCLTSMTSGESHALDKPAITIGRSPTCDICIDSGLLSRHHATFITDGQQRVALEDHASTNGTFVNSMRVTRRTELKNRDVITLGEEKLVFIMSQESDRHSLPSALKHVQKNDTSNQTMINSSYARSLGLGQDEPDRVVEPELEAATQVLVRRALAGKVLNAKSTPAVLVVKSGRNRGALIELKVPSGGEKQWAIGRSQLADVVLPDPTVSNIHAFIRCEYNRWSISDNQSTNGIKVNNIPLRQSFCDNWDVIWLSNTELIFRIL